MLELNPDVKVIISSGHSEEYAGKGILSKVKGQVKIGKFSTNSQISVRFIRFVNSLKKNLVKFIFVHILSF